MPSAAADVCISTVKANLHQVFEEVDPTKRREAIERIWSKSDDSLFVDPERVWQGHDAIDECVAVLVKKFVGWVFVELGITQVLPEADGDHAVRVVKQEWGYGPPGNVQIKGTDVAMLNGEGKMKVLYAILAPPG